MNTYTAKSANLCERAFKYVISNVNLTPSIFVRGCYQYL